MWSCAGGVWRKREEEDLVNAIANLNGAPVFKGVINDEERYKKLRVPAPGAVLTYLKTSTNSWEQGKGFFNDAPTGVAIGDAFVEAVMGDRSGELAVVNLEPHHKVRARFDFDYDPSAEAPMFARYIEDIWGHCEDRDDREKLLQEFVGAALVGLAPRYHRALLLQGEAGAGKSTFIHVLESMFPDGTVCHVGPDDFGDDDKLGMLIGAKLNTLTEAGATIFSQDRVKSIIEGEEQMVVRKWEKAASFRPVAAHCFAVNEFPMVPGAHRSFWDRWTVLTLTRRFRGTSDELRGLSRTIAGAELPGIVAWALEGARRLLEQNEYTRPPSSAEAVLAWRRSADSVGLWIDECVGAIGEDHAPWVPLNDLYTQFEQWRERWGFSKTNKKTFGMRLKNHGVPHKRSNGSKYAILVRGGAHDVT